MCSVVTNSVIPYFVSVVDIVGTVFPGFSKIWFVLVPIHVPESNIHKYCILDKKDVVIRSDIKRVSNLFLNTKSYEPSVTQHA